jgi:hypothetical protein
MPDRNNLLAPLMFVVLSRVVLVSGCQLSFLVERDCNSLKQNTYFHRFWNVISMAKTYLH